jgi:Fur family ferric uptake transcriptional regulator
MHNAYLCIVYMNAAQEIKDKGLKVTIARIKVLDTLPPNGLALSHNELEPLMGKIDRITLYRILNDFEAAGLVHKIIDMDGIARFAICRHNCTTTHHNDNHIHFNCTACHKMYCMDNLPAAAIILPHGFEATGYNTIIYGTCKGCN